MIRPRFDVNGGKYGEKGCATRRHLHFGIEVVPNSGVVLIRPRFDVNGGKYGEKGCATRQVLAGYFGPTYFYVTDHLGSTRLLTNYNGPSVIECDDYYPFGEQTSCGGTSTTTHKFTGYERDAESNLDNAQARYNSSSLGRFMSPDPIGNFVADATNPQTWNLYPYVNNNPLAFIDPTGTEINDEGDVTPHELPSDCTTDSCIVEVHSDYPGDTLTSDDLSVGGGPASVNGGGTGGSGLSGTLQKIKQAVVCAAGAPLIANSLINGNGKTTSSVGGTFGVTIGDLLQGRDRNYTVALNGDSQGNVAFSWTVGNETNGHGAGGLGYTAGVTLGTSSGTVSDQGGTGHSVTGGAGPIAVTASPGGLSFTLGDGKGARYSGAYDQTKTKIDGQTNCLSVAVGAILKLF